MKTSQLIKKLQAKIQENGDLDVMIMDQNDFIGETKLWVVNVELNHNRGYYGENVIMITGEKVKTIKKEEPNIKKKTSRQKCKACDKPVSLKTHRKDFCRKHQESDSDSYNDRANASELERSEAAHNNQHYRTWGF